MIGPGGLDMYYDRPLLAAVKEGLQDRNITHCHITVDVGFRSFDKYKEFLGRSLIYFHPCREAPMSRSRTEAMLSGACVITTNNQDAEKVFVDGENGILVPRNPEFICDIIEALLTADGGYKKALEIGAAGKETAKKLFSKERYEAEWVNLLNKTLKGWK
jgi:glycosyltransferase involved in cell wall biosynthesis